MTPNRIYYFIYSFLCYHTQNRFINTSIIERNDFQMADISKIQYSDGVIYNFKDNTATSTIELIDRLIQGNHH